MRFLSGSSQDNGMRVASCMKQALMKLASAGASFETTPQSADLDVLTRLLAPSTRVSVTFLPGSDFADTVQTSKRLQECGLQPVPTLCARAFRNARDLERNLDMLQKEVNGGVNQVFLFAGSLAEPVGDFTSSIDILETGLLDKYGCQRIGVAGHPEGLLFVDDSELQSALAFKNAFADRTDTDVFLVTQFCFEAEPIIRWDRKIREAGNRLPIHIGIPGIATVSTLLKYARNCGVGPSMRVLQQKGGNLPKLLQRPDKLLLDLSKYKQEDPSCGILSIHWYPFAGFEKTADYANAIAKGHFEIDPNGECIQLS